MVMVKGTKEGEGEIWNETDGLVKESKMIAFGDVFNVKGREIFVCSDLTVVANSLLCSVGLNVFLYENFLQAIAWIRILKSEKKKRKPSMLRLLSVFFFF